MKQRFDWTASDGFTLVELMVVVAIIGILSSIAIPNFQRFASKARQSEAKIKLAGIYTAEVSFLASSGSFSNCLYEIGYAPTSGVKAVQYYLTGFYNGVDGLNCGPSGTSSCNAYTFLPDVMCNVSATSGNPYGNDATYNMTAGVNASLAGTQPAPAPAWYTSDQTHFLAGAFGSISTNPIWDVWTIDQNKSLVNQQSGI